MTDESPGSDFPISERSGSRELGYAASDKAIRSVSIHIDLSAIRSNLATARRLSSGSKQFATIKADAYGHGAVAVAHALSPRVSMQQYSQPGKVSSEPADAFADGFAVVSIGEALELRKSGIQQPILVLQGPQTVDACAEMKRHDLWPVIHDMAQYRWYRDVIESRQLQAWLKVDTGMGRLGVTPDEAIALLSEARRDGLQWSGVLTHFASADDTGNAFTKEQIRIFNTVGTKHKLQRSMANSAAVLAWPMARADWARPGIMLYGCNPLNTAVPAGVQLLPAMTVSAPVVAVKQMSSGAAIGYGQSYHCPENMPVAYIALGYRDGLPRVLDASAAVTINAKRCPIIGRVSMDSIAVDARQCKDICAGMHAQIWGPDASIDELAKAAGTINYELLTSIRGSRHYTTGG